MIVNISGPGWMKTASRWRLRWVENGKNRCKTSKSKQTLLDHRDRLLGRDGTEAKPTGVKALPKNFDGSARAFSKAISGATVALNRAAAAGDERSMLLLRRYVAGLKDMASAIVPHAQYLELEEEHAKLIQYVEDIHAGKAVIEGAPKPKASDRSIATLAGRARSSESPN